MFCAFSSSAPLDINSATKEEPFEGKAELYRRNIISKGVYETIKDKVIAGRK